MCTRAAYVIGLHTDQSGGKVVCKVQLTAAACGVSLLIKSLKQRRQRPPHLTLLLLLFWRMQIKQRASNLS